MAAQNPPEPVASHDDLHAWMEEVFGRSVADMDPATAAQAMLAGVGRLGTSRQNPKARLTLADPPEQPVRYHLKVTLNHSKPPIWRRVSVPSDLTLDVFHDVVQAAMGWTNSHLHQFTTGDDRHGDRTETILTDWDIHEGEEGRPESDIRLDALVTEPGDKLHYWYDFGDDWRHTIVLEKVEPRDGGDDVAACVAGRRACPPEDIGGPRFYSEIFDVAEDSDHPDQEWAREVVEDRALTREAAAEFDVEVHDAAVRRVLGGTGALRRILDNADELNLFMAVLGWSLGGNPSFNTPDDWFNFTRRTQAVLGWSATGRVFNPDSHQVLLESSHARLMARGALSVH